MAAVLFVVGNLTLTAGNVALRDAMTAAGHTVTIRAASNADKTVTGFDAAVLASDATSTAITGYLTTTKGLALVAHAVTDDALMFTGGTAMTSSTTLTQLTPVGGSTFTAYTVASAGRYVTDAGMGGGAQVLARWVGPVSTNVAAWRFESGALLADGTTPAPGRRVFTPPLSESAQNATAETLAFFTAQVAWAAGTAAPPEPPTPQTIRTPTGRRVKVLRRVSPGVWA